MPRKHHTTPEALLRAVIEDLQSDTPKRYESAIRALVSNAPFHGPLHCVALRPDRALESDEEGGPLLIRAELWAFVREVVRLHDGRADVFGNGIWLNDAVRLFGNTAGVHVGFGIEGTRRNVAILQLAFLMERVGMSNVRLCPAGGCQHVFVKTYRRRFCSIQCQKRDYMRKVRATDRLEQEQHQRRQQRRRQKGASR